VRFRHFVLLWIVGFCVGASLLAGAIVEDYVRLFTLSITGILYLQIVHIAFAHLQAPRKRFANWVIWAMGYSYIIVTIDDVGTIMSEFGSSSLAYSTLLLAVSAGLAQLFLYKLAKEFGRA
jgi:hypothetical protein